MCVCVLGCAAVRDPISLSAEKGKLVGAASRPSPVVRPTGTQGTSPAPGAGGVGGPGMAPAVTAVAQPVNGVAFATTRTSAGELTYVTGFTHGKERLSFTTNSPGGLYEARVNYRAGGDKYYNLEINGLAYTGRMLKSPEQFATTTEPVRVLLKAGSNTVAIGGGWGFYDVAGINLLPVAQPAPPAKPPVNPCDPAMTAEARALLTRLIDLYGTTTLTGVYDEKDLKLVKDRTGKTPAVLGGDLIEYTPSRAERGADNHGHVEKMIQHYRDGILIAMCWHWNSPSGLMDKMETKPDGTKLDLRWYRGFYTEATNFNLANALADENGADYKLLLRDIDAIAVQLKKFDDAKVPVLWRPLHEADGGWFWWGRGGYDGKEGGSSAKTYVKLWRLMYDRLTKTHGLHNLIWVYTGGPHVEWYPGDAYCDIVGIDAYPKDSRDPLATDWDVVLKQVAGKKLVTLSECGFVPDMEFARKHGVYWSYFNTWSGEHGPNNLSPAELKRRFDQPVMKSIP